MRKVAGEQERRVLPAQERQSDSAPCLGSRCLQHTLHDTGRPAQAATLLQQSPWVEAPHLSAVANSSTSSTASSGSVDSVSLQDG